MKKICFITIASLFLISSTLVYAGNTILSNKAFIKYSFELCDDTKTGIKEIDDDKMEAIQKIMRANVESCLDEIWNSRFNPSVPKCIQDLIDSLKKVDGIPIYIYGAEAAMGADNDHVRVCVSDVSKSPYKTGYKTDDVLARPYPKSIFF